MLKRIKSVLSLILCFSLLILTACSQNEGHQKLKAVNAQRITPISLPQEPRFDKLLDENGKIITDYLKPETVSLINKNYDGRVYIRHLDKDFYYNPVYISYDQIKSNPQIAENNKNTVLEECFKKAKESGFKTVALYVNWKDFYNGKGYNYDAYKVYFDLAVKYDLYVSIIWIGYSKTGYMPWQSDRQKYPALSVEGMQKAVDVPDLSKGIYIDEAVEAITQFCGWLNYIDYSRRTVLIQLEDEANTDYGKGAWLSQYENYISVIEKMAAAVKNSAYKVVTTVGITLDDYNLVINDLNGRQRIDKLLAIKSLDGAGAGFLRSVDINISLFANSDKFCYASKISPASQDFFQNALFLADNGNYFGVFELKSFDLAYNCGMYRTHSTLWQNRDSQTVSRGILTAKRLKEAATADVIDFIKGLNSGGELLATVHSLDIVAINSEADNGFGNTLPVGDIGISLNNTANLQFTYNSAALAFIDQYSNYYIFSFYKTPVIAFSTDKNFTITSGAFIDGKWISDAQEIKLSEDKALRAVAGRLYRIELK